MNFTIRPLGFEDAALYRAIRLEALAAHPDAFGAAFEEEAARPLEAFAERLTASTVFGGFEDGARAGGESLPNGGTLPGRGSLPDDEKILGIAGFRAQTGLKSAHKGVLWGMYARPEARRSGLARGLVEAVLAHARGRVALIHLTVAADNAVARRLYEACGFAAYGVEARSLKVDGRYLDEVLLVKMLE